MPKNKCSRSFLIKQWISGNSDYSSDSDVVYCQICEKNVKCEKKFQLEQHSKTTVHIRSKENSKNTNSYF